MEINKENIDLTLLREYIHNTIYDYLGDYLLENHQPQIINITNREEIKQYINKVYELLVHSYSSKGGFLGAQSVRDLFKKVTLLTLYNEGTQIYAAGVYNNFQGGNKLFGLASDGSSIGKYGVHLIIKRDIEQWQGWYWCETSGTVEYLFRKYKGYNIPAIYAPEILHRSDIQIVDEYHYSRPIGMEREIITKSIFGFQNYDLYQKVQEYLTKQIEHVTIPSIQQIDKIEESNEAQDTKMWKQAEYACRIIGANSDLLDEMQMTDIFPVQVEMLKNSINILKQVPNYPNGQQAIELAEYILNDYTVLELHQFK